MRAGCWSGSGRGVVRGFRSTPTTAGRRAGQIRTVAALLTGLLFTLPVLLGSAPPAAADDVADVSIELTRLSPSIVRPDSTIVFEGRVTNVSDRPLLRLQATIWRSLEPLTTRAQLEQANRSAPTDPEGDRMYRADTPDAYQDLYTAQQPNLLPGRSKTFRVTAKAADFFDPSSPSTGVYLAGIQVREAGVRTVGRARTLIPVTVGDTDADGLLPDQSSIGSTTLVELTSTPTMARSGIFTDDSLAGQIAPGGRLDALLTAAGADDASYAVDPNLIVELRAMRAGYKVVDADGRTSSGKGSADAATWLSRFRSMQAGHDGFQLLYANADLAALAHSGRLDLVDRAQRAAAKVTETKDLPLLVTPADGVADRVILNAAGRLHARAVLLADTAVKGLGPLVRVPGAPLVLSYDTEAADGPGPEPRDTEVQVRQASLADSFLDSISGVPSSSLGRLRVVSEADQAGGESAALSAPWLTGRSAYGLLGNTPQVFRGQLGYPPAATRLEPNRRQLDRMADLDRRLTLYQNLVSDTAGISDLSDQAVARAASQAWRGHRRAMTAFIHAQQLLLRDVNGRSLPLSELVNGTVVRVESNPQVTLTGSSAVVPVTIINDLDVPITVQLLAESPNRSRLRLENIPAAKLGTIGAGAKVPAQVPTRVDANGTLTVTLQLATTKGDPIGQERDIRLNATQAGRIGWIIAIASGIVLLGTVVLRIRQVARERGDGSSDSEDDPEPHETTDQEAEDQEETVIRPRSDLTGDVTSDGTIGVTSDVSSDLSRDGGPRG
ncbi:DUF6049 family protein [Microlunatus sp. Gsoil 973]|uniref:DUF6049 family protein n=1 Tax=Microlunatus sp. Gsoil 973 TaxID=2672569 RepID=UPI0012B4D323|nr:DUF6049 family protein [Microlunatus sp. Gsoil 973]QGN34552.1 hypothetical protein GJV80_18930 [Microlunatus sp. Gsoil 973]